MSDPNWYTFLLALRELPEPFTSADAATAWGYKGDLRRSRASGWLSTFCRWQYVKRAGSRGGEKRWQREYVLTSWGKRFKLEGASAPKRRR